MVLNIVDSTANGPSELAAFSVDAVELGKPAGTSRIAFTVWHFQVQFAGGRGSKEKERQGTRDVLVQSLMSRPADELPEISSRRELLHPLSKSTTYATAGSEKPECYFFAFVCSACSSVGEQTWNMRSQMS